MPQDHETPGQEPEGTQEAPPVAPEATQEPQETPEAEASEEQEQAPQEPEETRSDDSDLWGGVAEDHPLRKTVADLRNESAARRTENRRLQESIDQLTKQLEGATTKEDFDAAIAEYESSISATKAEAARERVARRHGLPDALVSRLSGETEEELEADAQELKALLAPEAPTIPAPPKMAPVPGRDPGREGHDPKATANAIRKRASSGVH